MANKLEKVTEETMLKEIFEDGKALEILHENGVPCVTCPYSKHELGYLTIGNVSIAYGLNAKEIVNKLNEYLTKK